MKIIDHWQQFLRDNPKSTDTATLQATPAFRQSLLNRLKRAFDAGVEAGRDDAASGIIAAFEAQIRSVVQ